MSDPLRLEIAVMDPESHHVHDGRATDLRSPSVTQKMRELRRINNFTNLGFLALDYCCLIATIGSTIYFAENRVGWGIPWDGISPFLA